MIRGFLGGGHYAVNASLMQTKRLHWIHYCVGDINE